MPPLAVLFCFKVILPVDTIIPAPLISVSVKIILWFTAILLGMHNDVWSDPQSGEFKFNCEPALKVSGPG